MPEDEIVEMVDFSCPFCNQIVSAGVHANDKSFLAHGIPMCKEFDTMEPDEFLQRCNELARN